MTSRPTHPRTGRIDHRVVRLGKKAAKHDLRVPLIKRVMSEDPVPATFAGDWLCGRTTLPMLGNDRLGNCTSASKGHGLQIISGAARGKAWTPTDADAIAFYEKSTGYDPSNPASDQGGIMLDVLTYMVKHGYAGWRAQGFGAIGRGDTATMYRTIYRLGFVDLGLALPTSAQNQTVWDVPKGGAVGDGAPGSWGGHDALLVAKDPKTGLWKIGTWTYLQPCTDDFIHAYVDEAYGWKSRAFENPATGKAPNDFDDAALEKAMEALTA